jgi:hypothetical protein
VGAQVLKHDLTLMAFAGKPEAVPPSLEGEGNYAIAVNDEY